MDRFLQVAILVAYIILGFFINVCLFRHERRKARERAQRPLIIRSSIILVMVEIILLVGLFLMLILFFGLDFRLLGVISAFLICLLAIEMLRKITVDGNQIYYKSLFQNKVVSFDDIERVEVFFIRRMNWGMVLYSETGKLFSASWDMMRFGAFAELLLKRGIKMIDGAGKRIESLHERKLNTD